MPLPRPSRRQFIQQAAVIGIAAPAFIRNLRPKQKILSPEKDAKNRAIIEISP